MGVVYPSSVEKKLITWSGSDEVKIALQSLDRDLRLPLRNFLIIQLEVTNG